MCRCADRRAALIAAANAVRARNPSAAAQPLAFVAKSSLDDLGALAAYAMTKARAAARLAR